MRNQNAQSQDPPQSALVKQLLVIVVSNLIVEALKYSVSSSMA
jgi:hypothetical protein